MSLRVRHQLHCWSMAYAHLFWARLHLNRSNLFLLLSISHFMNPKLITFFFSNYLAWLYKGILYLPQIILLGLERTETFCYTSDWYNRMPFRLRVGRGKVQLLTIETALPCSITRIVVVGLLTRDEGWRKRASCIKKFIVIYYKGWKCFFQKEFKKYIWGLL